MIKECHFLTQYKFQKKEKDFVSLILKNVHEFAKTHNWGDIKEVFSQYTIGYGKGRIQVDVFLIHKDGTGTVIECKVGNGLCDVVPAIGQVLYYSTVIKQKLGNGPRLVIASPESSKAIYNTIVEFNLPIDILMVDNDRYLYISQ